ncbi:hypothetical protein CsSME_00038312 [Camellia sinensis var. sinensis]
MAAASVLKRQDGKLRRRPSKSTNRAWELARLTPCELRIKGESTPVGSCNPSHACADGIKGQLRGRFIIWLWAVVEARPKMAEHVWAELTWAYLEVVLLGRGRGPSWGRAIWACLRPESVLLGRGSSPVYGPSLLGRDGHLPTRVPRFARLARREGFLFAGSTCLELGFTGMLLSSVVMELGEGTLGLVMQPGRVKPR